MRTLLTLLIVSFTASCGCNGDDPPINSSPDVIETDVASDMVPDMGTPAPDLAADASDMADVGHPDQGAPATFYDVWEAIRDRLRESPDHRVARADALVAGGDPVAIFEFVRDEIATAPEHVFGVGFVPTYDISYYGARGTLRGGLGTPRDKVELLKHLLERAGYTSTVLRGRPDAAHRDIAVLYRRIAPAAFAPPIDDADYAAWAAVFAPDTLERSFPGVIDPAHTETTALADQLASFGPRELAAETPPNYPMSGELPFLRVDVDGTMTDMNPLWPDAEPGMSYADTENAVGDPVAADVTVRIWARSGRDRLPDVGETLVEGTWSDADLAGRRLVWRARPVMDLPKLLDTPLRTVPLFLSTLALEGGDVTEAEATAHSRVGAIFSPGGWRVAATNGAVTVNGNLLADAADDEAQRALVEEVTVVANGDGFRDVRLDVAALQGDGTPVPGLTASSFLVEEDGVPVAAVLTRNTHNPRLLLLADTSASVPPEFLGANLTTLGLAIADRVFALPPSEMVVLGVGQTTNATADWTSDRTDVEAQLNVLAGGNSALWDALEDAVRRDPEVVVFITDGQNTGVGLTPAREAFLRSANVPAIVLGVGAVNTATAQSMADVTGGIYLPVVDHAGALAPIDAQLAAGDDTPYELSYVAPEAGNATRNVTVAIRDDRAVMGAASYDVPAQAYSRGFYGLYMTITRGPDTITRTLAGVPADVDEVDVPLDAFTDVRDALFGSTSLVVEGGAPGWSQVLDDMLSAQISTREIWEARGSDEVFAALEGGFSKSPLEPYLVMLDPPLPAGEVHAHPISGRYLLYTVQPSTRGTSIRKVDILPLNRFSGVSVDAATSYRAALRRSTYDGFIESSLFSRGTMRELDGESLVLMQAGLVPGTFFGDPTYDAWRREFAQGLLFGWDAIVPEDGDPVAYWAIDPRSGFAYAGLPGGGAGEEPGGGGSADAAVRLGEQLQMLHSLTGLGGGIWLELEIAKAKQVAYATAAILNLGLEAPDPDIPAEMIEALICGLLEDRAVSALPAALREFVEEYNRLAGATGAFEATICP